MPEQIVDSDETILKVQLILIILKSKGLCDIILRYPYLDISDLQNWGKNKSHNNISEMNM